MAISSLKRYSAVALSFAGSAILLFSCDGGKTEAPAENYEKMMTEYSENLSMVMSENGRKSYHFETPLVEGYSQARDPYREFRKGVKITTYSNDSLQSEDAVLTANYAIYYENRRLWEAKGDVVVVKSDGKQLYTSQLFWNQATKRIYSNVDSKIVDGDEVTYCEGFESDEQMQDWRYRKIKGVTYFTMPEEDADEAGSTTAGIADTASAAHDAAAGSGKTDAGGTNAGKTPSDASDADETRADGTNAGNINAHNTASDDTPAAAGGRDDDTAARMADATERRPLHGAEPEPLRFGDGRKK